MKRSIKGIAILLGLLMLCLPMTVLAANADISQSKTSALTWLQQNISVDVTSDELSSNIDWATFALARDGEKGLNNYEDFIKQLLALHKEETLLIPSDFARIGLALLSMGIDVQDFNGFDFVAQVQKTTDYGNTLHLATDILFLSSYDFNSINKETLNKNIQTLLASQRDDGGFNVYLEPIEGEDFEWTKTGDVDATAIVLAALVPYQEEEDIVPIIETALHFIKASQKPNGGFGGPWGDSAESTAQVIIALTSLGIDPLTYIQEGKTPLDGLMAYAGENGGFINYAGEEDPMTTWQSALALVAMHRFIEEENTIYNLRDVALNEEVEKETTILTIAETSKEKLEANNIPSIGDPAFAGTLVATLFVFGSAILFFRKKS